jgi:hypothetical protein
MLRWMRIVQMLSAVVVVVGGGMASARPAVAATPSEECNCYDWYAAIAEQEEECYAMSQPGHNHCPWVVSCWKDFWGHLHFSGICYDVGSDPCPPVMPQGDCQP